MPTSTAAVKEAAEDVTQTAVFKCSSKSASPGRPAREEAVLALRRAAKPAGKAGASKPAAPRTQHRFELVVFLALLVVAKHVVGRRGSLELGEFFLIVRVRIWVVFPGDFAVGPADLSF